MVGMDEQAVQSVKDAGEPVAATARDQCTKADWAWEVAAVLEGRGADCVSVAWVLDDRNTGAGLGAFRTVDRSPPRLPEHEIRDGCRDSRRKRQHDGFGRVVELVRDDSEHEDCRETRGNQSHHHALAGARRTLTLRMEDFGMDCSDETSVCSTRDSSETDSRAPFTNPFL